MESQEQRLVRLEGSTARLVQLVAELRGERDRLRGQLHEVEQESGQLRKRVTTLRHERELVRSRLLAIDESLTKVLATEPPAGGTKKQAAHSDEPVTEELTLF